MMLLCPACSAPKNISNIPLYDTFDIQKKPKNIILMIGDGMGLSAVSAALYSNDNQLNMLRCPICGFQKTTSADDLITDSAAAATTLSCGKKTYNTAIGVLQDSSDCIGILEAAEGKGLATGLIATSSITHATPAAFIAHQSLRAFDEAIAADFLKTDIDIFIGGGQKFFEQRDMDTRNLSNELLKKGYYVSSIDKESIKNLKINNPKNIAFFTAESQPKGALEGRSYLPDASIFAARYLKNKNPKGFFMMIEGSQIDWAEHANKDAMLIAETLDFDKAVGKILDFAAQDGETLVIITADHECGGVAIQKESKLNDVKIAFTTKYHTATMIPVFAYGPGAHLFKGIYDNTQINATMMTLLLDR